MSPSLRFLSAAAAPKLLLRSPAKVSLSAFWRASGVAFRTPAVSRVARLTDPASSPARLQKALFTTSRTLAIDTPVLGKDFKKEQERRRHEKLTVDPENVTSDSSIASKMMNAGPNPQSAGLEPDMLKGVYSDLNVVRETFALREVPKEVYWFGMGGLVPYVVTSASTLYLAWDLQHIKDHGVGYLVSKETAESLLHLLEPTQVAYGAVILSFLGAIHWGLEFAQYGGSHPYHRYTLGILAPALAWPTIMLPLDYALLIQFVGFTGIYFADTQATTRGWAPKWYMTYRFILTFIVGVCIVITLIGRGKIGDDITPVQQAQTHLAHLREHQRRSQEQTDSEMQKRMAAEEHAITENREKKKKAEEEGEVAPSDPGKKAAGNEPGKQGIYKDDEQTKEGKGPSNPGEGQAPEPSGEKKGLQNPKPERPQPASSKGKA